MKIIQFIKTLNNTELGKGTTHETYILIPKKAEINDIFENEKINLRLRATAKRKELRILGLGNYYRENKLNPGDSILLEKIINNGENKLYISHRKEENILFFQKVKNRLEIFSPELINDYHNQTDAYNHLIKIEHVASEKKRTDSPTKTDFYEIMINNINVVDEFNDKEIGGITIFNNKLIILHPFVFEKHIIDTEVNIHE